MNKNIHFSLITLVICLFFHTTIHASEYDIDPLENQLTTSRVELDSEFPADIIPPSDVIPDLPDDAVDIDPTTVFGRDDRVYIANTKKTPYKQTVFLVSYFPGNKMGVASGVLIAPNKVLTAAHAIRDEKTNVWADSVTAFPGWNRGTYPYGGLTGSNFHVFSSYKNNLATDYTNEKMVDDLAVVTLPSSFSTEDVGYLNVVNNIQSQQRVAVIGYPGSKKSEDSGKVGGMYAASGPILEVEDKTIKYQIDTTKGHSGGPILNSNNEIVAINVAENNFRNFGRRINGEALTLINAGKNNSQSGNGISNLNVTYRLYHTGEKYHFYSASTGEKDTLVKRGWKYEGVAWRTDSGGQPVYRLYHTGTRRHLYTTNLKEKDILISRGWKYEGIPWHSMGNKNVYRLYHSTLKVHLYTKDENEKNVLSTRGWRYEGIAWTVEQ